MPLDREEKQAVDRVLPAVWVLAALAVLAVVPYWRAASLPFISDDYVQIWLGRAYGAISGWKDLALDPLYRCRATSLVLTHWTTQAFGLNPSFYTWGNIGLHVINTWLVFCLGVWRPIGWRVSAVAAGFFAVAEGHQEAVIWYAALPELVVFLFGISTFVMWVLWLQRERAGYAVAALAFYVLALLSKESAVALVPLALLPVLQARIPLRRWIGPWIVAVILALGYAALIFAGQTNHLFFHDGTFSLRAPFWVTIPRSLWRMGWIWGSLAVAAICVYRGLRAAHDRLWIGLAWASISFIPYAFLTYMPFVPSRHTYLASVGLAVVVGAAWVAISKGLRHAVPIALALAVVVVATNSAYIWTRKQSQFEARALPTEKLVEFARHADGPIYVHCFPYGFDAAEWAVELRLGKRVQQLKGPLAPQKDAEIFCFPAHGPAEKRAELTSEPATALD